MVGGAVRWFVESRKYKDDKEKENTVNGGILGCSGMIAGEGIIGVILAVLALIPVSGGTVADMLAKVGEKVNTGQIGGLVILGFTIFAVLKFTIWSKSSKSDNKA